MTLALDAKKQRIADLSLLLVTVIWGGTFPVIKELVGEMTPHYLVGIRFLLAFIALGVVAVPRVKRLHRRGIGIGIGIGLVLWGGYVTQTIGLMYTSAAKGGFITGLSVVIVPVLSAFWLKKYPSIAAVLGVVVATLGLGVMSLDFTAKYYLQYGDLWLLACAVLYACQVVLVDKYAAEMDAAALAWIEIGTVAAASLLWAIWSEPVPQLASPLTLLGLLYLAVLATALGQVVQFWAQPQTTPTRVGIILAMEPVFATVFAAVFLDERLGAKTVIGCALVLAGMLLAETNGIQALWQRENGKKRVSVG